MADNETAEDEPLELTEELEGGGEQAEAQSGEEEFSIELEGEEPEEVTPAIRQLRATLRDAQRELASLRKVEAQKIEVGEKPTLEAFDWDQERFDAEYDAWMERKYRAAESDRAAQQVAQSHQQEFQRKVDGYRVQLAALPVPEERKTAAEETVRAALPEILQSALLLYAKEPAKLMLALAAHPAKLNALAQEPDAIKFVQQIGDIERNLKVVNRKAPPAPEAETIQTGGAPLSKTGQDKYKAQLEKDADRTGDRSKLIAYRAQQRERARA